MKTLGNFILGSVLVLGAVLLLWPPMAAAQGELLPEAEENGPFTTSESGTHIHSTGMTTTHNHGLTQAVAHQRHTYAGTEGMTQNTRVVEQGKADKEFIISF
ncbi:MAG: hypothetical protein KAI86_03845 [Desulfobacterales bacterium]|nr:hypothetical protein [Desulfobacterales bacterium]